MCKELTVRYCKDFWLEWDQVRVTDAGAHRTPERSGCSIERGLGVRHMKRSGCSMKGPGAAGQRSEPVGVRYIAILQRKVTVFTMM